MKKQQGPINGIGYTTDGLVWMQITATIAVNGATEPFTGTIQLPPEAARNIAAALNTSADKAMEAVNGRNSPNPD